jgi:site-specific DNA-adenine methylase
LFAGTGAIAKIVKNYASGTKVICNDINPDVAGKIKFTDQAVSAVDAITYINNNLDKLNNDDFVFLDPPYHPETRPNSLNLYKYELSAVDHEQLLSSVLKLKCPVMIIHPACELYDDNLILDNGWRFVDLKIRYHNKISLERLYMNYAIPKKLLITKFLGKDCWDRQRIKRKGDRMIAKLKALPAPELQYILEKINNEIKL